MTVLIGCEYSATERDAFRAIGIDAWSCDLLPTEGDPRWHIQGDIRDAIKSRDWTAIILHLDCTKMAVCGNTTYAAGKPRHWERVAALYEAEEIVQLALSVALYVAVENPASVIFPMLRDRLGAVVQYIHPWQHGHAEQKKTGLALWGLPRIVETDNVYTHMMTLTPAQRQRIFYMSPGVNRGHERARAFQGIADAFADQWGRFLLSKPAPTQPHLVPAQVRGDGNNSPAITPFAAAGDSTASNLVSPDPVENFSHTDRTEGVTHRDLSQHADAQFTNRNEIVPVHGAPYSRMGNHDHE